MAINNIKLRIATHPDLVTVGVAIAWLTEDQNWIEVYNALNALNSGGALTPYAPATTYELNDFVSYSNNIWKYIGASPSAGNTPVVPSAFWELSSIGALTHLQNSDTFLSQGTADEVSAVVAAELINNQVISLDLLSFQNLYAAETLKKNRVYKITDQNEGWFIHTNDNAQPDRHGVALIRVPRYESVAIFGGWQMSPATFGLGVKVYWEQSVYNNLTGTNLATTPDVDVVNWAVIASTNNTYYKDEAVSVMFSRDFSLIQSLTDQDNNRSDNFFYQFLLGSIGNLYVYNNNFINAYGDTYQYSGLAFANNTVINSTLAAYNGNASNIEGNILKRAFITVNDSLLGGQPNIQANVFKNIALEFASTRDIQANSFELKPKLNQTPAIVMPDRDFIEEVVTPFDSTIVEELAFDGITKADIDDVFGEYKYLIGDIVLTSANVGELIDEFIFTNYSKGQRKRIYPAAGLSLDFSTIAVASVPSAGQFYSSSVATGYTLVGDNHDYIEIVDTFDFGAGVAFKIEIYINQ
jgi:hypothetical protein